MGVNTNVIGEEEKRQESEIDDDDVSFYSWEDGCGDGNNLAWENEGVIRGCDLEVPKLVTLKNMEEIVMEEKEIEMVEKVEKEVEDRRELHRKREKQRKKVSCFVEQMVTPVTASQPRRPLYPHQLDGRERE
nr:hypothetical protein Iba_chr03bCG1310 [Ipomoea batatas]